VTASHETNNVASDSPSTVAGAKVHTLLELLQLIGNVDAFAIAMVCLYVRLKDGQANW
jgi:hypothetical protein